MRLNIEGWRKPAAAIISESACSVILWIKKHFRLAGSINGFLSVFILCGNSNRALIGMAALCLNTTSANINPRANWPRSAPSANVLAMSNALIIFPRRRSWPDRVILHLPRVMYKRRPARKECQCSHKFNCAAPVPPSEPSTTTKSGMIPVASIALTIS